jgi:hypothetical protein
MAMRRFGLWAVGLITAFAVLYAIPTWLEIWLAPRTGPVVAFVLVGDLVGCVAIGRYYGRVPGTVLYIVLLSIKLLLTVTHFLPIGVLSWGSDFVPAVFASVLVADHASTMERPDSNTTY